MTEEIRAGDKPGELLVFDHGFVRLDEAMADDLSVVNGARVSFAVRKEEMDARDTGLIKFLMRSRHGSPFEHNSFRFHIRCPIFVAREWFRHRVGCLTGDTRISFVDVTGAAPRALSKSMDELWTMWSIGEKNGGALTRAQEDEISRLLSQGHSLRAVSRMTGSGRNTITRYLAEGTTSYRSSRGRLRRMRLRVLDEENNEFTTGRISEVWESGVQPVYRVTLADGKKIDATRTHRFLTDFGWQTLEEAVGLAGEGMEARTTRSASFVINGAKAYQDRAWMEQRRDLGQSVQEMADDAGCSYHTIRKWLRKHDLQFSQHERAFQPGYVPWNNGVKGYKLVRRWTPEQLEAIRKARSGPKSNFWRGGASSERASIARWTTEHSPFVHMRYDYTCQVRSCLKRGGRLHAHHIMPVWLDKSRARDIANLISVCDGCHRAIHQTQDAEIAFARDYAAFQAAVTGSLQIPQRKGCKLTGRLVRVEEVEYVGLRRTYDLSVEAPRHNFVANGIVVHNSFNEESARYHKLEGDFYIPSPQAVRSQVGKPGAYTFEPTEQSVTAETIATFERVYKQLYDEYETLVEKGVAKELARALLPFGIYTQFFWTLNARSLMNFLALRNSPSAQYEIRIYAQAVEQLFAERMPVTHACFEEFGRNVP